MSSPYVPFYTSDFLAGTGGMTASTKGVYITILCLIYEAEGPLPHQWESLARRCGCTLPAFKRALDALIADGKIAVVDGMVWSPKVEKHLAQRCERRSSAEAAAKTRWQKDKEKQGKLNAPASIPQCQPEPEPYIPEANASGASAPVSFHDAIWTRGVAFLVNHGVAEKSARSFLGKAKKKHGDEAVFNALAAAAKQGAVEPVAYITKALQSAAEPEALKLDAWGIPDAQPVRNGERTGHQNPESAAGAADMPEMLPRAEKEERPVFIGDADDGGYRDILPSLRPQFGSAA